MHGQTPGMEVRVEEVILGGRGGKLGGDKYSMLNLTES